MKTHKYVIYDYHDTLPVVKQKFSTNFAVTQNETPAGPNRHEWQASVWQEPESLGTKIFTGTIFTSAIEAPLTKKH